VRPTNVFTILGEVGSGYDVVVGLGVRFPRRDTRHNDTESSDIQHNDVEKSDTQHNDI